MTPQRARGFLVGDIFVVSWAPETTSLQGRGLDAPLFYHVCGTRQAWHLRKRARLQVPGLSRPQAEAYTAAVVAPGSTLKSPLG